MNRALPALILLTIAMQVLILARQGGFLGPPTREMVWAAPEGSRVDISRMPGTGAADSELGIIEFSDYECPFCQRHAETVRHDLVKEFVESGVLRYFFANNPLPIHPNAVLMAGGAICAGDQGNHWAMHDLLFEQPSTTRSGLLALAAGIGIEVARFDACLDSAIPRERIDRDIATAQDLELSGTPGFALGRIDGETLVVTTLIRGAQPLQTFERAIREIK